MIEKHGGPEVLQLKNIEIGKPAPNEVLVENKAIGLNFIDTYHRSGLYPLKLPSGIGLEASGVIKEIGSKVSNLSIGDNVAYASPPIGAYAKERLLPSNKIIKIPPEINIEVAAVSSKAKELIEQLGGSVSLIEKKTTENKKIKKSEA